MFLCEVFTLYFHVSCLFIPLVTFSIDIIDCIHIQLNTYLQNLAPTYMSEESNIYTVPKPSKFISIPYACTSTKYSALE